MAKISGSSRFDKTAATAAIAEATLLFGTKHQAPSLLVVTKHLV